MYIIVHGNPVGGFTYTGPFASQEAAVAYGKGIADAWCVSNVKEPALVPPQAELPAPVTPSSAAGVEDGSEPAADKLPEVQRVPVISTGHITEATAQVLSKLALRNASYDDYAGPRVAAYPEGFWLYVPDDWSDQFTSDDLRAIFGWFDTLDLGGDRWLRLDRDGPVIPALPTYDW